MPLAKIYYATDRASELCAYFNLGPPAGGTQGSIELDGTLEAVERFTETLTASDWYYLNTPRRTPRKIDLRAVDALPHDWLGVCHFDPPKRPAITLTTERLSDPWTVLHELAHVMTYRSEGAGHGRMFVKNFFLLVRDWYDPTFAWVLRRCIYGEGIKIGKRHLYIANERDVAVSLDTLDD